MCYILQLFGHNNIPELFMQFSLCDRSVNRAAALHSGANFTILSASLGEQEYRLNQPNAVLI